jgi:septal ring factor EnvC (AmiA/AmiB activator)
MVRQGLTMATLPGAPVSAVADGKVIFAGPFRSYGSVVILDHGGGFFSVYGQLGDIDAAKGTLVKAGDSIAVAGGGADAGRMYFEVRRGTDALDPTVWLEKR